MTLTNMTLEEFDTHVRIGQSNIKDKWDVLIRLASEKEEKEKYALLRNEELANHINHCIEVKANIKIK